MIVIFGSVASVNAYSSFAPWRMIPPHSWSVPGRKPGTSTNVTIGMVNASQGGTERAAGAAKARGFGGGVDAHPPRHRARLVADDADAVAVQAPVAAHDVLGE